MIALSVHSNIEEVLEAVGYLPPALVGMLEARFKDFIDHHKRTVIKRARSNFPGGTRAMRMVASRMFGYYSKRKNPTDINDLQGESFMAGRKDVPFLEKDALQLLEEGGNVHASGGSGAMVVPVSFGYLGEKTMKRPPWRTREKGNATGFTNDLSEFTFVRMGQITFVLDTREKEQRKRARKGITEVPIVGMVVSARYQPPRLEFYASASDIMPRHAAKIEQDVDKAIAAAIKNRAELRRQAVGSAVSAFGSSLKLLTGSLRSTNISRAKAVAMARSVRNQVLMERLAA